jgi:hypothetical protein
MECFLCRARGSPIAGGAAWNRTYAQIKHLPEMRQFCDRHKSTFFALEWLSQHKVGALLRDYATLMRERM